VFECAESSIKSYATDGYRIAEVTRELSSVEDVERFEINAKHLESAVKAIGAKFREDVEIEVGPDTVTITGGVSVTRVYREDIDGNGKYPDVASLWPSSFNGFYGAVTFNPKFLATLPKLAGMDQYVAIQATDNNHPSLFSSKDGLTRYLLMPVRA
jgi:DNA polymerase III sliding clamp (beta) subunit (PCNA family)